MSCEGKCDPELSLEGILKRNHGLFDIKIKVSIRDTEGLSLAYTPGVATPCLDIQKELARAYEQTNRANNVLIVTDSSKFCGENKCCLTKNVLMEKNGIIMLQ
jgi:malic enzyme